MSIWSSFAQVEPLREGGYGVDLVNDSWLDLADTGLQGTRGDLLRIVVWEGTGGTEASVVLDRKQARELRDHLDRWFERTPPVAFDDEVASR